MKQFFVLVILCLVNAKPVRHMEDEDVFRTSYTVDEFSLFRQFYLGSATNFFQIDQELVVNGTQIHPYAYHICGDATDKMINLPPNLNGFFSIRESYYTMPDGILETKPYFLFIGQTNGHVQISFYDIPEEIPVSEFRNNNSQLIIDYTQITPSDLNPATYQYFYFNNSFHAYTETQIDSDTLFIFDETIAADKSIVMADLIVDGKSSVSYTTPILYDRYSSQVIGDFDDLMYHLKLGHQIRVTNYYYYCDEDGSAGPRAIGGTTISEYEFFDKNLFHNPKGFVAFSDTELIYQDYFGQVYDFIKARIYDDSSVEIIAQYLNPLTFKVVMNETFACTISNAWNPFGGVNFFLLKQ